MDERYNEQSWAQKYPGLPFATLVNVIASYCDPNVADSGVYDEFVAAARDPGPPAGPAFPDLRVFREELRRALGGEWYPRAAVSQESGHAEGGPDAFLRRLWNDIWPDEPPPAADLLGGDS